MATRIYSIHSNFYLIRSTLELCLLSSTISLTSSFDYLSGGSSSPSSIWLLEHLSLWQSSIPILLTAPCNHFPFHNFYSLFSASLTSLLLFSEIHFRNPHISRNSLPTPLANREIYVISTVNLDLIGFVLAIMLQLYNIECEHSSCFFFLYTLFPCLLYTSRCV